ncbi:MAG: hypothetical protein E7676_06770 [Ruminococcaceae bacterium]|nr:hypothetical protein [Oscillospiraceae bacterium]
MKNRNLAKILTLVLSLALLIGSVAAINVSAADENPVKAATIVHGAKIQIAVAVDDANAEVTYYWDDNTTDVKTANAAGTKNVNGTDYPVFTTEGVAYYELAKVAHITVVSGGETYTVEYSVLQFLYAKMYRDREEISKEAFECYQALVTLGTKSQAYLGDDIDATALEDYTYIYTYTDGLYINGGKGFMAEGATAATITTDPSLSFEGYTVNGVKYAKNALPATFEGIVQIDAYKTYGADFESSVTDGVHLATGSAVIQNAFTFGETYTPATKSGIWGNIVSVTKTFENGRTEISNVLKLTINDGTAKNTSLATLGGEGTFYYAPAISSNSGNIHVLEFDFNWAQASKSGWRNPLTLFAYDADGNILGNIVDANGSDNQYCVWTINNGGAFNEGTVVENAYQMGISGTQQEVAGGKFRLFNSDTWYRLRYIWEEATGNVYISASDDGGETWYQACSTQTKKPFADAAYLAFSCDQIYGAGGYVYLDNINYNIVSELPELPANNGITE